MTRSQSPFTAPPAPGAVLEVAPGVLWARLPLPFALDHVNIYFLQDGDGWAVLDTGLGDDTTKAIWGQILATALGGMPITRLVVTHFHPDHMGMAGWLASRFGLPLHMNALEYFVSLAMRQIYDAAEQNMRRTFYQRHGVPAAEAEELVGPGHRYLRSTTGVPQCFRNLIAGETLEIGGQNLRIITGGGHSPQQVMLQDTARGLFISADQVLARISPNVSVRPTEPDADPLAAYLQSLDELHAVPADVLVLPGHGLPFHGVHQRIAQLKQHHHDRCDELTRMCATEPRSVAEIVPMLFRRKLDPHQMGFAIGEALAHVNHLHRAGRLTREDHDQIWKFRTV